uniref:SAND domain-containing protein n=2 Tax=Acrobeloides nanus TaxID=290746 RepID=A0A914CTC8_9BILA
MSVDSSDKQPSPISDVKSEDTSGDPDSGDEVPIPSPGARILEVRCGNLMGKLYEERFTCPGIHRRCIEFEGKLISPRQFTIRAEKDKQKDWKGSIRVGRYNLRTLMELKRIDFYEHETNCSLKCQSRNYIKNRKAAALESLSLLDSIVSSISEGQPSSSNVDGANDENGDISIRKRSSALEEYVTRTVQSINDTAALARLGIKSEEIYKPDEPDSRKNSTPNLHVNIPAQLVALNRHTPNGFHINSLPNGSLNLPNGLIPPPQLPPEGFADPFATLLQTLIEQQKHFLQQGQQQIFPAGLFAAFNGNGCEVAPNGGDDDPNNGSNSLNIRKIMESKPTLFWSRMRDLGILEDLLNTISIAVEQVKNVYLHPSPGTEEFAAQRLSGLANVLNLGDVFGEKIHARYVQTTLESSLLSKELHELQRKAEEQKRKLENAKRKSEAFDQIIKNHNNPEVQVNGIEAKKFRLNI